MPDTKPVILLVDDEPLNRELLRRVLHRSYSLLEAADTKEASEQLRQHAANVQLILCDHLMPGETGAEFAFRVHAETPIPFMLLTGFDGDDEVLRAQREGVVLHVVSKPWRRAEICDLIASVLEAAKA